MYYRIDWEALNRLPAPEKLTELANIIASVQRACGAERDRMVHTEIARHGGGHGSQKAAAEALGLKQTRTNQIAKETPVTVRIITCDEPAELYRRYQGEHEPQPCYVEVGLENQTVLADYDAEIGGGVPATVYHGIKRRYPIPVLTSKAANELLEKIRPLAERMCSDWENRWDGSNHVAVLGDDAKAAEAEIEALCGDPADGYESWEPSDLITVWDVDGATNGSEAEEWEITAATTDERLDEIEEQILEDLKGVSDSDEVVLEGVGEYLRGLRDEAVEAAQETLVWSVVRGESPDSSAVEPGVAGIDIPDAVLAWAEGHGLSEEDSDVYLLVTTEDEAGEVAGEIAYTTVTASGADATKVRAALSHSE